MKAKFSIESMQGIIGENPIIVCFIFCMPGGRFAEYLILRKILPYKETVFNSFSEILRLFMLIYKQFIHSKSQKGISGGTTNESI